MARSPQAGLPGVGGVPRRSSDAGAQAFRLVLTFALVAGLGLIMGIVVTNPNKRLIEGVGGGIFLLVALGVDVSFTLGVLLALLPFPAGMSFATSNEALVVILFLVYAVRQMIRGEPIFRRTPVDMPVFILVGAMVVSVFWYTGSQKVLEKEMRSFLTAVALFYVIVAGCTKKEHLQRLMAGFVIAIAGAAFVAVLQMFFPGRTLIPQFIYVAEEQRFRHYVRAAGTFGNYSVFGQYMALSTILVSHLFIRSRSVYAKLLYMAILMAVVATFLSSAMRGALFALAIGFVYMAVVGRQEVKLRNWAVMLVVVAVLLVTLTGVMLTFLGTGYMLERLSGFGLQRGSSISRMETNRFFFEQSLDQPLFGHGPAITLDLGTAGSTNNPHCQYLYYFYTIGIVGVGGFLWLLAGLYFYSLHAIRARRGGDPWLRGFLVVFHTMLVVFILHELVDDYMVVGLYHKIIWSMFAILVVLSRLVLEETPEPTYPRSSPGRFSAVGGSAR